MKSLLYNLGLVFILLYVSKATAELEKDYSSSLNDYNFNLSSKYDRAVFARAEDHFANAKVWQTIRQEDGGFTTPEQLNLGPSKYKYSDPMLTADGRSLIFISNRPLDESDKSEDYNIWQAELTGDTWSKIKPLPYPVNTGADELGPEMHDGILYYASSIKGYLSLYQAKLQSGKYQVSDYAPLQLEGVSRSDLTFSPDGDIALFWQLYKDKNDSQLMMQRKVNNHWRAPVLMPPAVQSAAYEFTPQFSPDGQWLYFASGKQHKGFGGLNIYKVPSELVLPKDWYQAHIGSRVLPLLASPPTIDRVRSFSYDFTLNLKGKKTVQHMAIEFDPLKICKIADRQKLWTDGDTGMDMISNEPLSSQEIESLMRNVRLNFIYMLKHDSTKFYPQYASSEEQDRLFRVESQGVNNFTVLLANNNTEIRELRYDNQALGLEKEYKLINGINWPMTFEYWVDNALYASGNFSQVKFNQVNACEQVLN